MVSPVALLDAGTLQEALAYPCPMMQKQIVNMHPTPMPRFHPLGLQQVIAVRFHAFMQIDIKLA